jgi:ubiquinone/menaquinone biosynthesis C-methylase UbiE
MTDVGTGGFLEPEKIVQSFGIAKGDYVADFGAGHGYFTIPLARVVGGDGKVYALDVQKEVLEVIRAKAKLEHLLNIELMWADLEESDGSHLKENFIDFAVIANILFQAEKKDVVLREAFRIIRAGGRMAIIEWDSSSAALGPPPNLRIKKETVREIMLQVGFVFDREFEAGVHHYGLLFRK